MRKGYSKFIKVIYLFGDLILLNSSFLISYILKFEKNTLSEFSDFYVFLHIVYNLTWFVPVYIFDIYNLDRIIKIDKVLLGLIKSILLHALLVIGFIFTIKIYYFSRAHLFQSYILFGLLIVIWRIIFNYLLKSYRRFGKNTRNVIIIGASPVGYQMYNFIKNDLSLGYKFLGFIDNEPDRSTYKDLIIGNLKFLESFVKSERVDEIFCALSFEYVKEIRDVITLSDNQLIRFRMVPDFRGFLNKKVEINFYHGLPLMTLRKEPLETFLNKILKRTFDILFSLSVIIFIFPLLFPIIALLIKISSKGPIVFKQIRNGRNNKEFYCYKFRSMEVNEWASSIQATKNDSRITGIGKILRKTNLDELPQFFNVLLGHMSVVGPRPHMVKHTEEYSKIIDKFMVRHLVKPGITGWAQVNGFRGATETSHKMIKRVRYDLWYIENWDFFLDLKILFMTIYNMFKGEKNAY